MQDNVTTRKTCRCRIPKAYCTLASIRPSTHLPHAPSVPNRCPMLPRAALCANAPAGGEPSGGASPATCLGTRPLCCQTWTPATRRKATSSAALTTSTAGTGPGTTSTTSTRSCLCLRCRPRLLLWTLRQPPQFTLPLPPNLLLPVLLQSPMAKLPARGLRPLLLLSRRALRPLRTLPRLPTACPAAQRCCWKACRWWPSPGAGRCGPWPAGRSTGCRCGRGHEAQPG